MASLPKLVAAINVTPDSFSDGGDLKNTKMVLERMTDLLEEGADIIDIGAESTNPKSVKIDQEEEINRLKEVLPEALSLIRYYGKKLSLDTRNSKTAEFGVKIGVDIINDVAGGRDPELLKVISSNDQSYIFMHSLRIPEDREVQLPQDINVVEYLKNWGLQKIEEFEKLGIREERLIFDPGIGFGVSALQSFEIIKNAASFKDLGLPILIGHSRKTFLNMVTEKAFAERDLETSIISLYLCLNQVDYIRVHNVSSNLTALKIANYLG